MATIAGFKKQFENIYGNSGEKLLSAISDEIDKTSDVIMDLNRDQLLYGRNAKGEELRPHILEDPYWDDKGGYDVAYKYMVNKIHRHQEFAMLMTYSKIQLFPNKSNWTPNLIHSTGTFFFNHFFINVSKDRYTIGSSGIAASDIASKYDSIYGLAPQSKEFYYRHFLRPAIFQNILKHLSKK